MNRCEICECDSTEDNVVTKINDEYICEECIRETARTEEENK